MENLSALNNVHLARLLVFLEEVLLVCSRIGILCVLCGGLAVLFHTRNSAIAVNDVDLACNERDFDRMSSALSNLGIDCRLSDLTELFAVAWRRRKRQNARRSPQSTNCWQV